MKFFIIFTYTLLFYKTSCIKNTNLHFAICFCVILTQGQINWLVVFGLYFHEQMSSLSKIHFRTSRLFSSTSADECDYFLLAIHICHTLKSRQSQRAKSLSCRTFLLFSYSVVLTPSQQFTPNLIPSSLQIFQPKDLSEKDLKHIHTDVWL